MHWRSLGWAWVKKDEMARHRRSCRFVAHIHRQWNAQQDTLNLIEPEQIGSLKVGPTTAARIPREESANEQRGRRESEESRSARNHLPSCGAPAGRRARPGAGPATTSQWA